MFLWQATLPKANEEIELAEFRPFLGISLGSIFEIKTQLLVEKKLGMGDERQIHEATELSEEVSKMLTSLIQKLSKKA